MDEKSRDPESIKHYTLELRELIDNDVVLSIQDINKLQKKYNISKSDLEKVENIALNHYQNAQENFVNGNWDNAFISIEEAIYKSPINIKILELYYNILNESSSFYGSEESNAKSLNLLLMRVKKVNKKLFKKLLKSKEKDKTNKKNFNFKKKYLFFLIVLIIPLPFFLTKKPENKVLTEYQRTTFLPPGEILVEIKPLRHTAQPVISVIESRISGTEDNFVYNLLFNVKSEKENITFLKGSIHWYDKKGSEIVTDEFESIKGNEYFLNELIPFSYMKNSHREFPSISKIVIEIKQIETLKGRERTEGKNIYTIFSGGFQDRIEVSENRFLITEGVTTNYLSLVLTVKNLQNKEISILNGDIEWIDDYNIVKSRININFISVKELPVKAKEKRVLFKTFEISEITDNYRINIKDMN